MTEASEKQPRRGRRSRAAEPGYQPMGDVIADRVRGLILDGTLAPGERIRQEQLAAEHDVSRIPVREALRRLEREGLVALVPHSGARVARLDFDEHVEVYRIRELLEPMAIAESARHITDEQVAGLYAIAQRFDRLEPDPEAWLTVDREFHLATVAPAPQPRLLGLIEGFWNTTQHYRRAYLATLDERDLELVRYEHRLILDALERRDPDDAASFQRTHIRRTRLRLDDHRELFER